MTSKTLKELEEGKYDFKGLVRLDHLRQEAIRWYHRSDGNKHKFIKEFFNLTDKQIKQGSSHKTE